ncbi:UNVERIFIED_CONTAM: hypothetical protein PYX00_002555 [Menopon gallinae]|uniref:Leucine-rich repeat-containing protein 51 n=1 Tax=Menopon gallinae TaxID=328185 RepID=A0AAW2IH08_9NEOP
MEVIHKKRESRRPDENHGAGNKGERTECSRTFNQIDPDTAGVPVDYSFRKVDYLSQLQNGLPREFRVGMPKVGESKRFVSRSIWANYNNLVDLSSISSLVSSSLEHPELISWLDVSFNQIQTISKELTSLHNLMILYLHGNQIQCLTEVAKLRDLKKLRTLTLHGNPIEGTPNYRQQVLKLIPYLKNLDFSVVADYERAFVKYTRAL